MGTLLIFVDGVGAGERDLSCNPLAQSEYLLSRFADGSGAPLPRGMRSALADACLGVSGRPQSATGQTTLFTGENAPALLGRHLLGFPDAALAQLLSTRSLFARLAAAGRRVAFANAFPAAYLRALGLPCRAEPEPYLAGRARRPRASASTLAFAAAGAQLKTWDDARRGLALTHDVDGARARALGASMPERSAREAAHVLLRLSSEHDLTLFEFFETDEAGHAQDFNLAARALGKVDGLLRAIAEELPAGHSLVVVSDHGNLEDLSTRNHTRSPVPVLALGPAAERLGSVRDLTGVAPMLWEICLTS